MKRISFLVVIFLSLILLFSSPLTNLAKEDSSIRFSEDINISELYNPTSNLTMAIVTPLEQQIARQGCCSWHGGVCGCSGGRVLCCDGTLSPSCTCYSNTN